MLPDSSIQKAIDILNDGGIIIFPTDTAFGIGCRIDNTKAVERLFAVRNRPHEKATPVLVSGIEMACEYFQYIPPEVEDLMKKYWPGGLTIILACKEDKVPSLVRGGGSTLGTRMPNHPVARSLIEGIGVPLLGPSANFAGERTPYFLSEIDPELSKLVDYVIEGQTITRIASTVINCNSKPWKILREGAVTLEL